ncbi:arsenate reductase (glutaredoxin), partial [Paracoccaceae bacterium]|nr:arsenate reductase (glutaredoxin) [Paracoccaceae bacterium]
YLKKPWLQKCGRSYRNWCRRMAMNEIWHNPRCSKSRIALTLLKDQSIDVHIFYYLEENISYEHLISTIKKLSIPVIELVRSNEKIFRTLGLDRTSDDEILIKTMLENPILIERPILVLGTKAIIGRPPERIFDLFN